jgi:uncharacterized protein YdcH (DUF465 family)
MLSDLSERVDSLHEEFVNFETLRDKIRLVDDQITQAEEDQQDAEDAENEESDEDEE